MKYRLLCLVLLAIFALWLPDCAYADTASDLEENVSEGLDNIDFSQADELSQDFFGSVADKIRSILDGEFDSVGDFWNVAVSLTFDGLKSIFPQLLSVFAVLVIVGLLRNSSGGLLSSGTDGVINFVGVTVILSILLAMIVNLYKQVYGLVSRIAALSEATMPILLTLLVANGGNALSAVCQPSMAMFSSVVIQTVKNIVLPMSVFALIFTVVSNISSNVKVEKASEFLTSSANWLIGTLFMLFSAFTTVQGISAASIDGVSYRAAKFATKSYIPILGGYLADGFDFVAASTSLIKNAFGLVALLLLLFLIIRPIISLLCLNLGLQAVSAVCEPIVDGKYIKMLGGIGKTLTFLIVLILAVAFMFCVLTIIAISCANGV